MRSPTVASGLVQVIHLGWGKSSRGGEGARSRAAVPLAFEVSAQELAGAGGSIHVEELQWGEANGFAEPVRRRHRRLAPSEGFRFGCVSVSSHPPGLALRYRWEADHGGAPRRSFLDTGDVVIGERQWGRICSNGRFRDADTGQWWYEQTTVNVAWFVGKPSGRIFLDEAPVHDLRLLSDLW